MITVVQAIILGALQGFAELFPISSLGHSVIFPSLVGWHIQQNAPYFLTFLVATHFATAAVLFMFFWKEWVKIIYGVVKSIQEREIKSTDIDAKLGWLLIVGTIPAGVLGLLFEDKLKLLFASPEITAVFLFCNGFVLLGAEMLRRKRSNDKKIGVNDSRIARLTWLQSLGVGAAQAIALIPGFSRTGSALAGGLIVGLSHEDAARFSFLLATPIIGAAALLKLPELFVTGENAVLPEAIVGALFSGVTAYFSVKFLTKYFKTNTLIPFGIYCLLAGGISWSILFFLR
jgi:undecaprenyl-diphosphatase